MIIEKFLSATAEMSPKIVLNGRGQINAIKNVRAILIRFVADQGQ